MGFRFDHRRYDIVDYAAEFLVRRGQRNAELDLHHLVLRVNNHRVAGALLEIGPQHPRRPGF